MRIGVTEAHASAVPAIRLSSSVRPQHAQVMRTLEMHAVNSNSRGSNAVPPGRSVVTPQEHALVLRDAEQPVHTDPGPGVLTLANLPYLNVCSGTVNITFSGAMCCANHAKVAYDIMLTDLCVRYLTCDYVENCAFAIVGLNHGKGSNVLKINNAAPCKGPVNMDLPATPCFMCILHASMCRNHCCGH